MELTRDGMLDKVFQDVFFGNGKPALTIRMQTVEDRQDRIESLLKALIWLGVTTTVGTLGTFAVEVFKVVMK